MKTTIDLPPQLLERTKIAAAKRRVTLKRLIIEGLESVLKEDAASPDRTESALSRLRGGYRLGGQPLSRETTHARE